MIIKQSETDYFWTFARPCTVSNGKNRKKWGSWRIQDRNNDESQDFSMFCLEKKEPNPVMGAMIRKWIVLDLSSLSSA